MKPKIPFRVVKRARKLYEEKGLPFREVAKRVGYSHNTVKDWLYYKTRVEA